MKVEFRMRWKCSDVMRLHKTNISCSRARQIWVSGVWKLLKIPHFHEELPLWKSLWLPTSAPDEMKTHKDMTSTNFMLMPRGMRSKSGFDLSNFQHGMQDVVTDKPCSEQVSESCVPVLLLCLRCCTSSQPCSASSLTNPKFPRALPSGESQTGLSVMLVWNWLWQ